MEQTHNLVVAGFDSDWISGEVAKHGPELEQLLLSGLSQGFSKAFLVELVSKGGSLAVSMLTDLMSGMGGTNGLMATSGATKVKAAKVLAKQIDKLLS